MRAVGLLAAATLASVPASSPVYGREVTAAELRIVEAFDRALRSDDALDAVSRLPWAGNVIIENPHLLSNLRTCKAASRPSIRSGFVSVWYDRPEDPAQCLENPTLVSQGAFAGYGVNFKLRKGRIQRLIISGGYEIIVGGAANDR